MFAALKKGKRIKYGLGGESVQKVPHRPKKHTISLYTSPGLGLFAALKKGIA
jgi:hypothetical protein